jgi:hypothetical protein
MYFITPGDQIKNFILHIFAYFIIIAYKCIFEYIRKIKNIFGNFRNKFLN